MIRTFYREFLSFLLPKKGPPKKKTREGGKKTMIFDAWQKRKQKFRRHEIRHILSLGLFFYFSKFLRRRFSCFHSWENSSTEKIKYKTISHRLKWWIDSRLKNSRGLRDEMISKAEGFSFLFFSSWCRQKIRNFFQKRLAQKEGFVNMYTCCINRKAAAVAAAAAAGRPFFIYNKLIEDARRLNRRHQKSWALRIRINRKKSPPFASNEFSSNFSIDVEAYKIDRKWV